MSEMTNRGSFDMHPSDIICAIQGSEKVTLSGFGAEPAPASWMRPGLKFVAADEFPATAVRAVVERQQIMKIIRWVTYCLLLSSGIGAGFWLSTAFSTTPLTPRSIEIWSVTSIQEGSVSIRVNNTNAVVRIGQVLPNGEILQSTLPSQQAYITDKSTTMLNKQTSIPFTGEASINTSGLYQ